MVRKLRVDVRLATQVLLLQVAVVTLTLGIAGGLLAFMSHQRLAAQYETRSLDMARAIAFAPAVRADVARYDAAPLTPSPALTDELANGQLQTLATEIQQRTGVLFVVITNDQGIRLSHPNRDELGKHVSTDPSEALAGHEVVIGNPAHSERRSARKFLFWRRIRIGSLARSASESRRPRFTTSCGLTCGRRQSWSAWRCSSASSARYFWPEGGEA